jgi:hypothetical protein
MSTAVPAPIDYKTLVRDDRIHASLHTDPRIFAEELERIPGGTRPSTSVPTD